MPVSDSQPKRLLVTGGRGRLASLIADYFKPPSATAEPATANNRIAHDIVLYSRTGGSGFGALAQLAGDSTLGKADALLHLAWSTLPATAEQNPGSEVKHDLPLLEKLLQSCAALPPGQRPHFIFFSSGGTVYGNATGRPNVETDPCHPIGKYGRAKLAAEQLIQQAVVRDQLPGTILRISNPYGYPVPSGRVQGIIPHAIRCAMESATLTLWGDGHARKDFIHYTDFLAALNVIVTRRLTGLFNLCSGESHSVHEIIELVEDQTGSKIATTATPAPPWDVENSRLANDRFVQATGWRPLVSLNEGIRRSVAGNH